MVSASNGTAEITTPEARSEAMLMVRPPSRSTQTPPTAPAKISGTVEANAATPVASGLPVRSST